MVFVPVLSLPRGIPLGVAIKIAGISSLDKRHSPRVRGEQILKDDA